VAAEITAQEALFPGEAASAKIYRPVSRPRGRAVDLAITAGAILRDAELWTLNAADFTDIPRLRVR